MKGKIQKEKNRPVPQIHLSSSLNHASRWTDAQGDSTWLCFGFPGRDVQYKLFKEMVSCAMGRSTGFEPRRTNRKAKGRGAKATRESCRWEKEKREV